MSGSSAAINPKRSSSSQSPPAVGNSSTGAPKCPQRTTRTGPGRRSARQLQTRFSMGARVYRVPAKAPQDSGRRRPPDPYHGPMRPAHRDFIDSKDFARIGRALRYIETHFREQPRLATLAAQADLSEFHFNRLFHRWAGLTPKQYLAFVTGNAAKRALNGEASVLDA